MDIEPMAVAVATLDNAQYVAGRRAFFKYRDLGVTAATHGRMRAQVTSAEQGMSKPTGWHVHKCEAQFIYILSGWVDLEFADRKVRLSAGESMLIPGDTPHNETGTSDTFELLELSTPADMGTEPCAPPPGH
jgi:mannose-6-phosphate isomerase-like protein (cupin superfamily)